jgi:hypothetical protein
MLYETGMIHKKCHGEIERLLEIVGRLDCVLKQNEKSDHRQLELSSIIVLLAFRYINGQSIDLC